jgi:uncharacterized glyoxalase superfamily protein PhnB
MAKLMKENPDKIVNNLVLELHVPDFTQAREFYAVFGFKQIMYDPESGGGSDLGYMVLRREDEIGNSSINFYGDKEKVSGHVYFKDFPTNTPRGYEVEITIPVSGVEKLWNSVKDKFKPSQIAQPLTLKRWGKKDFRLIDPFGFYVRFTELVDWGQ